MSPDLGPGQPSRCGLAVIVVSGRGSCPVLLIGLGLQRRALLSKQSVVHAIVLIPSLEAALVSGSKERQEHEEKQDVQEALRKVDHGLRKDPYINEIEGWAVREGVLQPPSQQHLESACHSVLAGARGLAALDSHSQSFSAGSVSSMPSRMRYASSKFVL